MLNLSQDLVTLGIAASNMTPDTPGLDSRPLFEAGVAYAAANGIANVVADRGSYYFLTQHDPNRHVLLSGLNGMTIDLHHSDLYFNTGNVPAIQVLFSTNVTLQNVTVDYLHLPFTQVTVTGVANGKISIRKLGNYPLPSSFNALTISPTLLNDGYYLFAFRNGQQLRTTGRMAIKGPLNDTSLTPDASDPWVTAADVGTVQAGDVIVLIWRAGGGAIDATFTTGYTLHNVSVYASGYLGATTYLTSNATFDHVQIIPRPGTDRLISSNADGIHLGKALGGNMVTNNTVRRGGDDAFAIDGQWYYVVSAANGTSNGKTIQVTRHDGGSLSPGQSVEIININNANVIGTATIVSESPAADKQTGAANEPITLTLDQNIAGVQPNFGVTPADPNLRGGGTVFSGNLVQEEVFARGIYPAGVKNVTVTDNLIQSTNQAGILVTQDEGLIYNYKTGPSSGLVIQNNVVDSAMGYGIPSNQILGLTGSIVVSAEDLNFNWVTTQSLSNITVDGNFITNSPHSAIRMENVAGGEVSNNFIANAGTAPNSYIYYKPAGETLAQLESEQAKPLVIVSSTQVTSTGNTTLNGTAGIVRNRSYADGSYRLAPESIAVAVGTNLSTSSAQAATQQLPTTLAGVSVTVTDNQGVARQARLYAVAPGRVEYVVPKGTAPGVATVTIGNTTSGALISKVAPALFSADGTGTGAAKATAIRYSDNGQQVNEPVYACTAAGVCTATAIDLGQPSDIVVLTLEGTGIRGRSKKGAVIVSIGGAPAEVLHAARLVEGDHGADEIAVQVPQSLAGAGLVPVVVTVDGFTANAVMVNLR